MAKSESTFLSLVNARIVFVFHGSELGGAERQGLLLARELKKRAVDVLIIGLQATAPGRVAELCQQYGLQWRPFSYDWPHNNLRRLFLLVKLAVFFLKLKPDVLLPYTWMPNMLCCLLWRFTGASLCVWNQRDEGRYLEKNYWNSLAIHFAPVLVANATVGKEFLENQFNLRGKKVLLIPNAVFPLEQNTDREACRAVYGLNMTKFVAVMVANLHSYKDHSTLLKAWKLIVENRKDKNDQPILLLAGRFAGMESELDALICNYGLCENVKLLGEVRDINGLLAASDIYLHSSKTEGMPNAVLEAMSMALPVVATDIPGIREAVGMYGEPYLCPVGDSKRMAELIELFYCDIELRKSQGRKLHEWVTHRHDLQKMVSSMVNIVCTFKNTDKCILSKSK